MNANPARFANWTKSQHPALPDGLTFCGSPLDPAGHLRANADYLAKARADPLARILLVHRLEILIDESGARPEILWLGPQALGLSPKKEPIFLGLDAQERPHFALEMPRQFDLDSSPIAGLGTFCDVRSAAAVLKPGDCAIIGCARSLVDWHARHGFCAQCGEASRAAHGGWKRVCAACDSEHFPRVDPVAIMLAVREDHCLLGRQRRFPPGMYSALAGFIEPGESLEEGCQRELLEEAGIHTTEHAYVFSQFWPFPSSLMLGLIAQAQNDDITIDPEELEDARWFSRADVRFMLAGSHPEFSCPPPFAIAHHLLRIWAQSDED